MKKLLIILSFIFLLTGCNNKSTEDPSKEKLNAEIKYMSSQLAELLHDLNNISLENYELVSEQISLKNSGGESSSRRFSRWKFTIIIRGRLTR